MGMDSSTAQHHHQEMGSETLESMLVCSKPQQEKKPRPADMESLKCPRCDSINTKFCYYNNYSLSQPRYFCKSCRRYWTKGGTLRNVPVGGGCRKNKRSSSSSPSPSSSSRRLINQDHPIMMTSTNPTPNTSVVPLSYDHHSNSNDLSLAIARLQKQASGPMGLDPIWGNPNMPHHGDGNLGLLDAIRSGFLENGVHQNLYYGMGNGCMGMENGGMGMSESREMGIPYEELISGTTTSTAVKEEMCVGGGREGETKGLFGFPWQNIGSNEMTEFDSGRLGWNGIGSSSWHGLLNSPLM